jgi:hypothetical protein
MPNLRRDSSGNYVVRFRLGGRGSAWVRRNLGPVSHTVAKRFAALLLAASLAWPGVVFGSGHSHGQKRSRSARESFKRAHPCPSTGKKSGACPGYTIDHIKPLKRGGADAPSNMQWQTRADAKAKDRWE